MNGPTARFPPAMRAPRGRELGLSPSRRVRFVTELPGVVAGEVRQGESGSPRPIPDIAPDFVGVNIELDKIKPTPEFLIKLPESRTFAVRSLNLGHYDDGLAPAGQLDL